MRIVLASALLTVATALCGCASDQIPSWALAAAQNQYRPQRSTAKHDSRVKIKIAHFTSERVRAAVITTNSNKVDTKLISIDAHISDQDQTSSVPSKYKDLAVRLREWDLHQDEENRRINTAIAICHC